MELFRLLWTNIVTQRQAMGFDRALARSFSVWVLAFVERVAWRFHLVVFSAALNFPLQVIATLVLRIERCVNVNCVYWKTQKVSDKSQKSQLQAKIVVRGEKERERERKTRCVPSRDVISQDSKASKHSSLICDINKLHFEVKEESEWAKAEPRNRCLLRQKSVKLIAEITLIVCHF